MAMLAEGRKKQKWTLNPRGSAWANDSSKIGEKLLRKMGWSDGQGLGVKKQGITEHIKVRVKQDSKGLGFKENDQVWVEVENDFSNLLSKLSSQSLDSSKAVEGVNRSLEEQSKKSKARVHYQKFTRGKDLSRYSKKDLESIFGVSSKNAAESHHEENKNFVPSGDMKEYFSKKISDKRSEAETKTNSSNSIADAVQKNERIMLPNADESQDHVPKKKKKKGNKRKHEETEQCENNDKIESELQEHKRHKKEKKQKKVSSSLEAPEKKKETINSIETNIENSKDCGTKSKKKKKKSKAEKNILIHQIDGTYDSSEVEEFLVDPTVQFETNCIANIENKVKTKTEETNQKTVKKLCKKLKTKPKSLDKVKSLLEASTEMQNAKAVKISNEEVSKNVDAIVQAKINNYLSQVFNRKDKISTNPAREMKEKKKQMVKDDESCVQFNGSNICVIAGYACY